MRKWILGITLLISSSAYCETWHYNTFHPEKSDSIKTHSLTKAPKDIVLAGFKCSISEVERNFPSRTIKCDISGHVFEKKFGCSEEGMTSFSLTPKGGDKLTVVLLCDR